MTTVAGRVQRYKNDTRLRKRLFVEAAFAHPAKGHISMWQEMVERYSVPGDTVLDPLAGIGTSLVAALMGRNVICVELEPHFVEPMRRSWEKMRNMPMLGYNTMGQVVILRGDARALPLPDASAGSVITSPPWEKGIHDYEHGLKELGPNFKGRHAWENKDYRGYTRPVDAIVTSPPYQMENPGLESGSHPVGREYNHDIRYAPRETENIGNLRSDAYWEAMRQVYAECWRVLRPGGVLALVLKGFTRDGKYVDLPGQTEALLLAAGWQPHDSWRRELWSLSFWRILQKRRDPAAFDDRLKYEEVLAFRKPEGAGKGVDAVISSPPYEGSLVQEASGIDEAKLKQPYGPNSQFARPQAYTRPAARG